MAAIIVAILGLILGLLIYCAFVAWPVMLLWDWLMPTLFGLHTITLWQAAGLVILCGFLFKSGAVGEKK